MAKNSKYIVGIDIGTTKTCTLISEVKEEGGLNVIGIGECDSEGMRKGLIVNLDKTVKAIKESVEAAELMAGVDVEKVYAGVSGNHIKGYNMRGMIAISNGSRDITEKDVDRVVNHSKDISVPGEREIIHVLPQEFLLDGQEGIGDPTGMSGSRLEALVHIVTAAKTNTQNIVTCINRAGIEVEEIILEQLAASEAVLTADEKELGVGLVEIGGGTTAVAVFEKGSLWHSSILPSGGEHFTNDIAVGLRTPIDNAEKIKKKHGCAMTALINEDETIEVSGVGGRKPKIRDRLVLGEIIQPRAEEIFNLVNEEIREAGYENVLNSGIVLTGGGASMDGMCEMAEQIFDLPVRRGNPQGVGGLKDVISAPSYAASVGLILHGYRKRQEEAAFESRGIVRFGRKIKEWLSEYF